MPETTKITETGRRGIESVNPKLSAQYDSIIALLRSRLGPEHAFLFAEPVPLGRSAKEGRDIAWFVPGTGNARLLEELGDESHAVRAKLERLVAEIRSLSRQLQDEGGASREVGRFLQDALVIPDAKRIWSVDGRPVLVDWGYRNVPESTLDRDARSLVLGTGGHDEKEKSGPAEVGDKSRPLSSGPISAAGELAASETIKRQRFRTPIKVNWRAWPTGLLWLLFVAILVGIGGLLLQACAISTPSWARFLNSWVLNRCPGLDRLDVEAMTTRQIEAEIRVREASLIRKLAECQNSCPMPGNSADAGGSVRPPIQSPTNPAQPIPGPSPQVGQTLPPATRPLQPLPPNIKRGKIEVTLAWEGGADLDLFVGCPDGGEISFRAHDCGGELVADLNRNGGKADSKPIEHIIWGDGAMQNGRYSVRVLLYKRYIETRLEIPYQVYLRMNDRDYRSAEGQVSQEGSFQNVFTFEVPIGP